MDSLTTINSRNYTIEREKLERLLAYNIGYALLENSIGVLLGADNAGFGREGQLFMSPLAGWKLEAIYGKLWESISYESIQSNYAPNLDSVVPNEFNKLRAKMVMDLVAKGKLPGLRQMSVPFGVVVPADAVVNYLGPMYGIALPLILKNFLLWAEGDPDALGYVPKLPYEESSNAALGREFSNLAHDKSMFVKDFGRVYSQDKADALEILFKGWDEKKQRQENEYQASLRKSLSRDRNSEWMREMVTKTEDNQSFYLPPSGYTFSGNYITGMDYGGISYSSAYSPATDAWGNSATEAEMKRRELAEWSPIKLNEIQKALNAQIISKQQAIELEGLMEKATNEFMGIPYIVGENLGSAKAKPKAAPEPEPISPFEQKPRVFSFEEE